MHFFRARLGAFVALLFCSAAAAQTPRAVPGFDLEQLTFNPAQQASLVIGTGDLLQRSQLHVSLLGHYEHNPLVLIDENGSTRPLVRNRVTAHLLVALGLTDWLEVGLQVPVVVYQHGQQIPGLSTPSRAALGTPWLQARLGFLSEARGYPLDVSLDLGLGAPIGSSAALSKSPNVAGSARLGAGKAIGWLRLGATVGAMFRQKAILTPGSEMISDEIGSELQLGASLTTTNTGLRGELSYIGRIPFSRTTGSSELLLGGRYKVGIVDLFLMAGPGFGRTPGTPAFRVIGGAGLSIPDQRCEAGQPHEPRDCPQLDLDGDSILNADDQCPREPGLPAYNGCPERDPDQDGVLDPADKCPSVAGPASNGGCPLPVDTDKDGLLDSVDRCPTQAGPKENKGCPWPDTDRDGLEDRGDACPKESGPKENKGCPWPDPDGDGLTGPDDACPNEAGPADRKGCPIRDTDGDTVPDELDNCPKVKGVPENQGCPKENVQLVVITRGRLVIKQKVFFDTGKATIKPQSFNLLKQVGRVLSEHLEIEHVRIEGHTDNVGKPEANRILSQRRAESVREFLIKQGVAGLRLEAQGFGPDRPADANTSAAGRENNRRVEFVVTTAPKADAPEATP